jgi:hypothetical protein
LFNPAISVVYLPCAVRFLAVLAHSTAQTARWVSLDYHSGLWLWGSYCPALLAVRQRAGTAPRTSHLLLLCF